MSVMTFGGDARLSGVGSNSRETSTRLRLVDNNFIGKQLSCIPRNTDSSRKMENSCETGGGVNVKEIENFDSMQVETEPAENFDEMSPCGCPQQQYLLRT